MKKILFLHTVLDVGGAEVTRLVLLRNIDRLRYNIKICCIGKKGRLGEELERMGYRIDELRQNPASLSPLITYKLIKYIKRERPDVLHSSLFNANFHARIAGLLCRIPCLITEEHGEHEQYKGIKFIPYILSDFLLANFTYRIVCCSKELMDSIVKKENLPKDKVINVDNCLDVNMYKIRVGREEIRKRHRIADEAVFIVTATLKAGKGHEYLIGCLKEIKELGYSFKCFFVGDGPLRDSLKFKVESLKLEDTIIFLGNVDNIADYLNASDIFVLPSFSEGLSIALMEAMLMGLPCIVTDVGSNPVLIQTGFNGAVIAPGNTDQLKFTLLFYLDNRHLFKLFGGRAQAVIKDRYSSIDNYVKNYYSLWDTCLDIYCNF
jgi:glycosyltransferase involved in cell wall biosynthesis